MSERERKVRLARMVQKDPNSGRWLCHICQKSFVRQNAAMDHIEGTHIRILSYPCNYCQLSFECRSFRRTHVFTHHREQNKLSKFLSE